MKTNMLARIIFAIIFVVYSVCATAEDIDIYSQNAAVTADAPNVLIILDNSANWSASFGGSTKYAAEQAALVQVVNALKTQFNLGLMLYTESAGGSGPSGGYPRFAIQGMTDSSGNATNARNCLLKMLGSATTCTTTNANYSVFDTNADKGSAGFLSLAMAEAYDYFAGVNGYAGQNKTKSDPLAFTSNSIAGPQYQTPRASGCQKNFIIHISNGGQESNTTSTSSTGLLSAASGDTTIISPPDSASGSPNNNPADEWARFLYKTDTSKTWNAITYTLEVAPTTSTSGQYYTSILQSMGTQGKGGYYSAVDSSTLLDALTKIFNDIQGVNSVFASSSLPLSADNSGAYLNQVYIGVFRPDATSKPRWYGNLKEYQFALDSNNNLYLADAAGSAVASGTTGFAKADALSFWTSKNTSIAPDATAATSTSLTTGSTGGFWFFDSKGSGATYDSPDGEWVEKGGAAEQLRLAYLGYGADSTGSHGGIGDLNTSTINSKTARQVYTCTGSCLTNGTALSTTPFDSSNTAITDALLGTTSVTVSGIVSATSKSVTALSAGTPISITSISKSGGAGTATTSSAHGFTTGDSVAIAGTTSGLNGTYTVTVTSTTQFTFTASNGNSSASSGTATKTTTTATATSTAHGFTAGQTITIAGATPSTFNGVVTVATVPTANTFTYTLSTALGQAATGTITATSNTATATATAHGLNTGNSATISGATPSGYNGTYVVTVIDANTFTYTYPTAAPLAAASGSINVAIGGGRSTLIKWVRGQDTQNENGFQVNGADTDVRASIHGDILHSRPVVLNYGTNSSQNVYIFYGGNDGVFRAIKGGTASTDGKEQWAFIPQEFFSKFLRLYNNSPLVLYKSTNTTGITPTPTTRDYFWDGPVGAYVKRDSSGNVSQAILFISVRRGGRFIYAIDVTSPTVPKFLWKKGCPNLGNNTGCDAGFAELGQTWSQLQVVTLNYQTNPVLVFGGGYDPTSEDPETPATTDTMGRGVFVLDALTGNLIWSAGNSANGPTLSVSGMNFSITADVLPIDRNFDGAVDRIYAADVGGNLWRFDVNDADTSNWKAWKIATVGDRSATASTRKFLFGMDVVYGDTYDSILIGTGDREHPLSSNTANGVTNRFYMFKDTNIGDTGANLGISDTSAGQSTGLFDATNSSSVPTSATGWYITLAAGEKVVNSALVVAGNVLFGTNKPDTSNTSCTANLGISQRYSVSYLTGAASGSYTDSSGAATRSETAVGGGFLPSPVTGVVELSSGNVVFVTDNPLNPGGTDNPTIVPPTKRYRTYWKQYLE